MQSILDVVFSEESRNFVKEEVHEALLKIIQLQNVSKGDILLRKGDISTKVYFVRKGLLRSYAIDEKGKEHIFMFAPEGWVISDTTLANDMPSDLFIDAIEDSELEVLNKQGFEHIQQVLLDNQMSISGREKIFKRVAVLQKRIIMLMSASAWERYQDFVATYPNIVQRVPQRMIASYLGITPEALSKIRGDMAKKQP